MKVLVLGGTRYFGVHLVGELLAAGHEVTVATRGTHPDPFGEQVERIRLDRTNAESLRTHLAGKRFDVAYDNLAYCSEDVRGLLQVLEAGRYVVTSTGAVYELHRDMREEEFDPLQGELAWAKRDPADYSGGKRQMERAVFQSYRIPAVAVRFPYVIGKDDYTRRLAFYVEHVRDEKPMWIDNLEAELSFIHSKEAGRFLAWLAGRDTVGAVNASNEGTVTLRQLLEQVESLTGKKAILDNTGDPAPYNGTGDYSLCCALAGKWGYRFPELQGYFGELLAQL